MQTVDAVKDPVIRERMYQDLLEMNRIYADYWILTCNTGLRCSDVIALTMDEIRQIDFTTDRPTLTLIEKKTGKQNILGVNNKAASVLKQRLADYPKDTYLFESKDRRHRGVAKPVNRRSIWLALSTVGKRYGQKCGSHSGRKTLGYAAHAAGHPIESISNLLNHSGSLVTLQSYIGLTQEDRENIFHSVEI